MHPAEGEADQPVALAATSYPDFVEERIRAAAQDHRDRLGIRARSDEQLALAAVVRTDLAWPELCALTAAALILVLGILLAV